MTADTSIVQCQWGNQQYAQWKRLFVKPADHTKAIAIFLIHNGAIHSTSWNPDCAFSFQNHVLRDFSEPQLRRKPEGGEHSILWMIRRRSRIEEHMMNLLQTGTPQKLQRGA